MVTAFSCECIDWKMGKEKSDFCSFHGFKYWLILIYIDNIIAGFEVFDTILTL